MIFGKFDDRMHAVASAAAGAEKHERRTPTVKAEPAAPEKTTIES